MKVTASGTDSEEDLVPLAPAGGSSQWKCRFSLLITPLVKPMKPFLPPLDVSLVEKIAIRKLPARSRGWPARRVLIVATVRVPFVSGKPMMFPTFSRRWNALYQGLTQHRGGSSRNTILDTLRLTGAPNLPGFEYLAAVLLFLEPPALSGFAMYPLFAMWHISAHTTSPSVRSLVY